MPNADSIATVLAAQLEATNYPVTAAMQQQLLAYLLLLAKWNRVFNLTSVRDLATMVPVHILDSLSIINYLNGERILDVGSGAGLPGIPLAIALPEQQFVLLDSNGKKTRFLTQAIQQLQLTNVSVVHARVESYLPEQCFNTIISRAFSNLTDFLAQTQHLSHDAGQFLAMKGQYPEQELAAVQAGYILIAVHKIIVPGLEAQRHLICYKKGAA